jgi:purine-binding chemotaxis protein CheW
MSTEQLVGPEAVLPRAALAEDVLPELAPTTTLYEFADALDDRSEAAAPRASRIQTWVTFDVAAETYGVPVERVHEILRVSGITRVPHAPPMVRGVTNMRGRILAIVDVRRCLGVERAEIDARSRILVVSTRGRLLGLLVDGVDQVERLDRDAVQPPPPDVMTDHSDYIVGVIQLARRLVILLEIDRVLALGPATTAISIAEGEQP